MSALRFISIVIGGFRGRYAIAGQKTNPPALLLATPLARIDGYRPTIKYLAREYRVYAVEMPGCGRSESLDEPWSLTDYARWADGFLEAFGLHEVLVIGHSHAGGVALLLSALYPKRVGRFVMAGGIGSGIRLHLGRVMVGRCLDVVSVEFNLAVREWHYLGYCLLLHRRNFFHQVRQALDANLTSWASHIRVPVLIAWGARDHTMPLDCGQQLARSLPYSQMYISRSGSHCWLITHAEEFAVATKKWTESTR